MNRHIKSLYSWARNYAEGGPKRDKFYNTQLTPQQEQQYQQWVQTLPINLRSDYDYDLRGAWLNGDLPDQNYHMTDKWKKPWHPTFSNESVYSTPQAPGGHWDGDTFIPSTTNKFINDFHYGQWGANGFAKGGPKKRTVINPEWDAFQNRLKQGNVAENIAASRGEYWDRNWYDPNYKSGLYSFDDSGVLTYQGQTYAPFGNPEKGGIAVPVRTPHGISYGANVVYYPIEVPQQYIEEEYYEPEPEPEPAVITSPVSAGPKTNDVVQRNRQTIPSRKSRTSTSTAKTTQNTRPLVYSIKHNPYKDEFVNGDLLSSMWKEYEKRYNENTLTEDYKKQFGKSSSLLFDYEKKRNLYMAPDSISPIKRTGWIHNREEYNKLNKGFSNYAPGASQKISRGWLGRFNYIERYSPQMDRTDILTFNPNTGELKITKGALQTRYTNRPKKEYVGAKYIITPKAAFNETKEAVKDGWDNIKYGAEKLFSGKNPFGSNKTQNNKTQTTTWGNATGLAYGGPIFAKGGYKAYSKTADKLNEEYGIDMSMSKKAFRQNRKNAWAGLEQSQRVAEQLASQTPYQMTPSERVENYIEGNNIPVDAGNYVYNYRQAKQRDAYNDYVSYISQLANPTAASFANRVAERPDYRGVANLETALALSPLAFSAAGNTGKLYKILTHPVTDMALTAQGAITAPSNIKNGIENIRNGNTGEGIIDLGLTALDITGAGQLLGRTGRMLNRAYRAKHAYNTIAPVSYEGVFNRGKQWIKDLWYNPEVDLHNPRWFQEKSARDKTNPEDFEYINLGVLRTGNYLPFDVINRGKIADRARMDAWAIYNGLPQPYNTYIKNADGTYSYDMKKIMDLSHGTWHPAQAPKKGVPKQDVVYDFVTGAGGGLTDFKLIAEGDYGNGIMRLEDTWDLHPFSRDDKYFADKLRNLLIDKIGSQNRRNAVQKLREKLWDKGIFGLYGTPMHKIMYPIDKTLNNYRMGLFSPTFEIKSGKYEKQVIRGLADKLIWDLTNSAPIRKFSDKLRNFEVGTISGGKPFKMKTDIPFYNKAADPDYITQMNNIAQIQDPVERMRAKWLNGNMSPYAYGFNPKYFSNVKPILASDNFIIDTKNLFKTFAEGGPIHIKPENRGKFTAAANRAGKSVQAYASQILANKDHYSTTLVKRANFAKNAKKFHH